MGDTAAAPVATPDPTAGSTPAPAAAPAAEPAAPPAPEPGADKPQAGVDPSFAQAEYTRATQELAEYRRALGFDRKAPRQDVIAAIEALKSRPEPEPDAGEPPDPRIVELEQRAFNAELRVQAAIYGNDLTTEIVDLVNVARTVSDPSELVPAFASFLQKHIDARTGSPAPTDSESPDAGAPPNDVIGLPEGDATPPAPPTPPARGRESGVVTAVRDLFKAAASKS